MNILFLSYYYSRIAFFNNDGHDSMKWSVLHTCLFFSADF